MAAKWEIQQRCEYLNKVRAVRTADSYSLRQFWKRARGSFLITGGTERSRTQVLVEKLGQEMAQGRGPSVVLTASTALEAEMVGWVRQGRSGKLCVTSPDYRNYHFFCGWSQEDAVRFLILTAEQMGYGSEEMSLYIQGFLDVLCRCYPLGLGALSALAGYDDKKIEEIGAAQGASLLSRQQIAHYAQAGMLFRMVLQQVEQALSPLTLPDCVSGYSLSTAQLDRDGVYLVNIQSCFPELMELYFSMELRRSLRRGRPTRLVCADLPLGETSPLWQSMRAARQWNAELGLSARSTSLLEEDFQAWVVLLDGGWTDSALETALRPLGSYTHYEAVPGGQRGFGLWPKVQWSLSPEPGRLRVRPADTDGCDAVLYGSEGKNILLARHLRY